ncbi:6086_t:CDS:2 [Acaulospora morrowiae]|uniref:6086_t:CDS:1 n=1 Tax=Acaulospora morrowiae TaxID=94023 RepID=A0A9N9FYB1_9GLOM|nr:6086_t:CDS:2 [Acaulospora morrowiae]
MVAKHLRINGTLVERDVQNDPETTKDKSSQVINTLTATSGHHHLATLTGNHHVSATYKQTSSANKLLKPSATQSSKTYTSTTSTLPDQSNLSSTDGGNESKTSFQWFGVILIAATIIIIMIAMICRKYKSHEHSYRVDDHDAHDYPSPAVIKDSGGDRSSKTLVHELEMEHQGISSMNRMTLSDYNDYSDAIQPDYPSFESLFPNPPERVVSKK